MATGCLKPKKIVTREEKDEGRGQLDKQVKSNQRRDWMLADYDDRQRSSRVRG